METSVPAGTVTPLENVNGRNARRVIATGLGENKLGCCTWVTEEEIQRTEGETINALCLPDKTVDLIHLVHSSFRPTFFCNHCVDLLAERLDIFRIRKKTVENLGERLSACND